MPKGYLGCEGEPLVAAWQAQAVTSRVVVIHHQRQLSSVEFIVCWHLSKASHTGLDQVLQ